jgi:fructokinase
MLQAGGLERLASDPAALHDAVLFAAATGALTCTRPGAIGSQPTLEEVEALAAKARAEA